MTMTLKKQTGASVATPPTGFVRVFADSTDSLVKGKNDDGVVRPIGNEVATDLATAGLPIAIDGGAAPVALGSLLMITSLSPLQGTWLSPLANAYLPFLDMANVAVIDDGDSPFTAVVGTCIPVDLSGAAADVEINLPSAAANLNREVWVKIVSAVGVYVVTLNRYGSDTIDGQTTYELNTDYEWVKLRAVNLGGGSYTWSQVG